MKFNPWKVADPPNKKTTPLQRRRALAKAHRAVRIANQKPEIRSTP